MIITDGKSQDPVEEHARKLKNIGVEVFVLGMGLFNSVFINPVIQLYFPEYRASRCGVAAHVFVGPLLTNDGPWLSNTGIKGADEDELKEIASTPYKNHVFNVPNFDLIKEVQRQLINEVCAGVEDQLAFIVSGEEGKNIIWKLTRRMVSLVVDDLTWPVALVQMWFSSVWPLSGWISFKPSSDWDIVQVHASHLGCVTWGCDRVQTTAAPHAGWDQAAGAVRWPHADLNHHQGPGTRDWVWDQPVRLEGLDTQRTHNGHGEDPAHQGVLG